MHTFSTFRVYVHHLQRSPDLLTLNNRLLRVILDVGHIDLHFNMLLVIIVA